MKQQNNTHDSTERWVEAQYIRSDGTIETYSNYMVSDHGRISSLVNHGGNKRPVMKILKPHIYDEYGHLQICLYLNRKKRMKNVHRLVLSSFCPEGWSTETNEVDHLDRNPANNHLVNLRWIDRNGNDANRAWNPLKKIRVTYLDDGHVEEFDNMMDCSKAFGKTPKWCDQIIRRLNGFVKKYNIKIEKIENSAYNKRSPRDQ